MRVRWGAAIFAHYLQYIYVISYFNLVYVYRIYFIVYSMYSMSILNRICMNVSYTSYIRQKLQLLRPELKIIKN